MQARSVCYEGVRTDSLQTSAGLMTEPDKREEKLCRHDGNTSSPAGGGVLLLPMCDSTSFSYASSEYVSANIEQSPIFHGTPGHL
ncbi:hypothetical protein MTO96_011190 [Rhipicephalus appendiculatus]